MRKHQVIADEVLDMVALAVARGEKWMAYNNSLYFIDKEDVCFFKDRGSAISFSESNYSDFDNFKIMHVESVADVLKQIPYANDGFEKPQVDPDANGLYNHEGNAFTDALIDHIEQQQFLNNSKMNFMNEQNFQYLKDNIKYMGFGENMSESLEANLKQGKSEFTLSNKTEVNKKPFEVNLHFRKSDNSDMYFFNSYNASLQRSNGEKVDQTFYLTKGKGITAKEAYNMLEGRAVFKELSTKEGQAYKAWVQLDFDHKDKHNNHEVKQYHENYGYDLKAAASKFAISELTDPEKEKALMQSLQKGNIQSVTIEKEGTVSKMFLEANPQFKAVTLYDAQMKRMQKEELGPYHSFQQSHAKEIKLEVEEGLMPDKKKEVKQGLNSDEPKLKKKKENSLLPKKRESTKKGLGVS